MPIDNFILKNRKFISRILKSECSYFIFFYKKSSREFGKQNYIVIKKDRLLPKYFRCNDDFPYFSSIIIFDLIHEGIENKLKLDISHFYKSEKPKNYYYTRIDNTYSSICNLMNIDIENPSITENEKEIYELLKIDKLDLKYFYKLIDQKDFLYNFGLPNPILASNIKNNEWKLSEFYGLIIKQKNFSSRQSDYGDCNTYNLILSDTKYILSKSKIFQINHQPNGEYDGSINDLLIGIYDYYYEGNDFICVNFDLMPNYKNIRDDFTSKRRVLPEDKIYPFPNNMLSKTYILSTQNTPDFPNFYAYASVEHWSNPINFNLINAGLDGEILATLNSNDKSCLQISLKNYPVLNESITIEISSMDMIFKNEDLNLKIYLNEIDKKFILNLLNGMYNYHFKK